jgi:hypothetical protein
MKGSNTSFVWKQDEGNISTYSGKKNVFVGVDFM